ncbi:beta family protein [Brevundimonas sp. NIBR11]|uniref:beta family protein n=1 Tax=Brevundimonas sp. NIBR11 TaxID=3015999 RepID=UPI0022F10CD6|nr:beta family protein [Brevundimonas sp. NIBR11]WGM32716.1 hypothetical protein KKHFBJBL_02970 [Brevundimonas sp. NIBR11]
MHFLGHQSYFPKLRLKQGEYLALRDLANDVAQHVAPHIVAPPPKERDPEKGRPLTNDEMVYETGRRVGQYWPMRPCLLDAGFLVDALGEAEAGEWLPRLFRVAVDSAALPTPVFGLGDIEGALGPAVQRTLAVTQDGIAIRVTLTDLLDPDLTTRLHRALLKLVLKPHECVLILDFSQADLTLFGVHETVIGSFRQISEIGLWNAVVFQATNYPEANPAAAGGQARITRLEWETWKRATAIDEVVRRGLSYGDFAADSAKFKFGGKRAKIIPHYRYATMGDWRVDRGGKDESMAAAMARIARQIVESKDFAGRDFCRADEMMHDLSLGLSGPGNATTWRRINIGHHITRVVVDLGGLRGFQIARRASEVPAAQLSLFGFNS